MPKLVQQCPLCGTNQNKVFDQRVFRGQTIVNRICSRCGFVFLSPRYTNEELAVFYEQDYRSVYQGSAGPTQRDLAAQSGRAKSLTGFTEGAIDQVNRYLDIGCSAGILLNSFRTRYKCEITGIEPGEAYRLYCINQGLVVYPDLQSMQNAQEHPFDFISLAHVLEHIPDPVEYLVHLRKNILCREGWLLIEVPNLYAHDCFEIAHLCSYSAHTLREVLNKAGFIIIKARKHGQPRSTIIPLYLTVLAKLRKVDSNQDNLILEHDLAYEEIKSTKLSRSDPLIEHYQVIPEQNVWNKRRLGMLRNRIVKKILPRQAWIPAGETNAK